MAAPTPPEVAIDEKEMNKHLSDLEKIRDEQELEKKLVKMNRTGFSIANWMRVLFNRDLHREVFDPVWLSIDEYKSMADETVQTAWRILQGGAWRLEKRGSQRGDVVESTQTEKFGKVFRFTGVVECPPEFLYEEFRDNMARLPEWNPTILKSELIKEIAPGVDLTYQVTAGGGRGIIAPRDFVILRRATALAADGRPLGADVPPPSEPRPHAYISSGVSVQVPGYPPNKNIVRGHNKVACWVLRPGPPAPAPASGATPTTVFQWLMSCDLKGRIPEFVLDTAFTTVMLDYIVHVRKHVAETKAKGLF